MLFLYDSGCGFCKASVARLRSWFPRVSFQPAQETDLASYGLTEQDAKERAWLIHAGKTYGGGQAVTGLLASRGAAGQVAAKILGLAPLRIPIDAIYRLIARNRYRLPRI